MNSQLKDRHNIKLKLPGKTLLGNTTRDFIMKRKQGLAKWLDEITAPEVIDTNPSVRKVGSRDGSRWVTKLRVPRPPLGPSCFASTAFPRPT